MSNKILLFLVFFVVLACGKEDKREKEIAEIPVEVEVLRFDERFARATEDSLPSLKREFPYLFPKQYHDSVWVNKLQDTIQKELNVEVEKKYEDFSETRSELHSFFQHVKYYFPKMEVPVVVTLTSEVDYRNSIIWAEDLLLISLDTYLGADHHFYIGIEDYLKKNFEQEQIVSDVASAFGEEILERPESRTFLTQMIYYGKILYLKDRLIPFKSDAVKIGYTQQELAWARENEEEIWRYFVERELLFATDSELSNRFIFPAPFSKFYLRLDREAPPKLGQFIGWQIVRDYMERQDLAVDEMLGTDAETVFNESYYKPKK